MGADWLQALLATVLILFNIKLSKSRREQTCTLSTRATTLTSAPCLSQAGESESGNLPSSEDFQHLNRYQFHLEEFLKLEIWKALPPLPFSAPSWECHLGRFQKAEKMGGSFSMKPLDPRYVDKWGRKLGCIVYLIIEAHQTEDFSKICWSFQCFLLLFLGVCWVSSIIDSSCRMCNLFVIVAYLLHDAPDHGCRGCLQLALFPYHPIVNDRFCQNLNPFFLHHRVKGCSECV